MNILVTGGAGFIGRWVVARLLGDTPHRVLALDNFSNSSPTNLDEFRREPRLEVVRGNVHSPKTIEKIFTRFKPVICIHLAAQIIVQNSIDDPETTFRSDVEGAFRLLEACRERNTRLAFMSTCMVYDFAAAGKGITETHPTLSRSPYAASKLAGEQLAISYHHAYGLPTTVMRPFNTYGPFQKSTGEGGVIAIFIKKQLNGKDLLIYGTGRQTRDFLYVEDCADFILRAAFSPKTTGRVLNACSGRDITINRLARLVVDTAPRKTASRIRRVKHIHPQSEIQKLLGNCDLAKKLLGWKPATSLEDGIAKTREWLIKTP